MKSILLRLLPLCFALFLVACDDGVAECPASNATCSGQCTDLAVDRFNCGGCGIVCGGDFQCIDGGCACLPGQTACGADCTDLDNDARNCGGCGNVCSTGQECREGACIDGCSGLECGEPGAELCVDPQVDAKNCGACGNVCPAGASCIGGACSLGDLYAACATEGTVVPVMRESHTIVSPRATGIDSPQALALLGNSHLLAVGEGVNPMAGAFDEAGTMWVSSWLKSQVIPVDFSGNIGVAGDAIALDVTGVEGVAYPTGVAVVGDTVYVTYNNLDGQSFQPAGNGRLATYTRGSGEKKVIDLGESCTNPGFTAVAGTEIYVACTNSYVTGEVAIFDTATGTVTKRVATGGAPARISIDPARPGFFYAADAAGRGFFAVDDKGASTRIDVCPEAPWEFNSDVVVAP